MNPKAHVEEFRPQLNYNLLEMEDAMRLFNEIKVLHTIGFDWRKQNGLNAGSCYPPWEPCSPVTLLRFHYEVLRI